MAEAVSVASVALGVLSAYQSITTRLFKYLQATKNADPRIAFQIFRMESHRTLLKVISPDIERLPEQSQYGFFEQAYMALTEVESFLSEVTKSSGVKKIFKEDRHLHLVEAVDKLEIFVFHLRDMNQFAKGQKMEKQLDYLCDESLRQTDRLHHEFRKILAESEVSEGQNQSLSAFELRDRQNNLEEMQQKLHSTLGRAQGQAFAFDPLCFPFVIPSKDPGTVDNVVAQLKLDTGAVDNWIRSTILERARIEFERIDDARTFIGAGGTPLSPFGKVKIVWYSENQAITRETSFLVHNQLPFDVILGSNYILGSLVEFSEPLLPLRHILTKDDYQNLQAVQQERGATNEEIIALQKEQDKKNREDKRKLKAATRAATPRAATPSMLRTAAHGSLFPPGTPIGLSRRSSVLSVASMSTSTLQSQKSSETPTSESIGEAVGEGRTVAPSFAAPGQGLHDGHRDDRGDDIYGD